MAKLGSGSGLSDTKKRTPGSVEKLHSVKVTILLNNLFLFGITEQFPSSTHKTAQHLCMHTNPIPIQYRPTHTFQVFVWPYFIYLDNLLSIYMLYFFFLIVKNLR